MSCIRSNSSPEMRSNRCFNIIILLLSVILIVNLALFFAVFYNSSESCNCKPERCVGYEYIIDEIDDTVFLDTLKFNFKLSDSLQKFKPYDSLKKPKKHFNHKPHDNVRSMHNDKINNMYINEYINYLIAFMSFMTVILGLIAVVSLRRNNRFSDVLEIIKIAKEITKSGEYLDDSLYKELVSIKEDIAKVNVENLNRFKKLDDIVKLIINHIDNNHIENISFEDSNIEKKL